MPYQQITKATTCKVCLQAMPVGTPFVWIKRSKQFVKFAGARDVFYPRHPHDCILEIVRAEMAAEPERLRAARADQVETEVRHLLVGLAAESATISPEKLAAFRCRAEARAAVAFPDPA